MDKLEEIVNGVLNKLKNDEDVEQLELAHTAIAASALSKTDKIWIKAADQLSEKYLKRFPIYYPE